MGKGDLMWSKLGRGEMRRQRNTAQIKEQSRNSDQINKEEISNLPEREFGIMTVKIH